MMKRGKREKKAQPWKRRHKERKLLNMARGTG